MKKEILIKIENDDKIIKFEEFQNKYYLLIKNLTKIIKSILEIESDITIKENKDEYIVLKDKEKVCEFYISDYVRLNKFILILKKDNILFEYNVQITEKEISTKLVKTIIENEKRKSYALSYDNKNEISIIENNNQTYIEVDDNFKNTQEMLELINNINFFDRLEEIYNKIQEILKAHNIAIKKSVILDKSTLQELITDLIIVEEDVLKQYKSTVKKKDKIYIIEKNNNNCSIKTFDSSIESLNNVYFELNEQMSFIKKLENIKKRTRKLND